MNRPAPTLNDLLASETWLPRLARTMIGEHLHDELVQDVRLAVLESAPTNVQYPRSWLRRVAQRRLANLLRSEDTRRRHEGRGEAPAGSPGPVEAAALKETRRVVAEAVLDLQAPYRDTILALYYQGMTAVAFARASGCSESTVRVRHRRALSALRQALSARSHDLGIEPRREHARRPAASPDPDRVRLTVVESGTGTPVVRAAVDAWNDQVDRLSRVRQVSFVDYLLMRDSRVTRVGTTDSRGTLFVDRSILARDALRVSHPGFAVYEEPIRHRLLERDTLVVELARPCWTRLRFVDQSGGPVRGLPFAILTPRGGTRAEIADEDGSYLFEAEEAATVIAVDDERFVPVRALASCPEKVISLRSGQRRQVRVVDSLGQSVSEAKVSIRTPSWAGEYELSRTGEFGTVLTPPLVAGSEASIVVDHAEFVRTHLDLDPSESGEIVARLERGTRVTATIVNAYGGVASSGTIHILGARPDGDEGLKSVSVSSNGEIDLGRLRPGGYDAFVALGDQMGESAELCVSDADSHAQVHFQSGPTTTVSGHVRSVHGEGVGGVALRLGAIFGSEVIGQVTESAEDGSFEFEGVPHAFPAVRATEPWDYRWWAALTSLGGLESTALVLQVLGPHQLLQKGDVDIESHGTMGSSNTCMVYPEESEVALTVADPPRCWPRFHLLDERGRRIRVFTHMIFKCHDGYSVEVPAGLDGTPRLGVLCPEQVCGPSALAHFEGRGWQRVDLPYDLTGPVEVIVRSSGGSQFTVRVVDAADRPVNGLHLFITPVHASGEFSSTAYLGTTDERGEVRTVALDVGAGLIGAVDIPKDAVRLLSRAPHRPPRFLSYSWRDVTPRTHSGYLGRVDFNDGVPEVVTYRYSVGSPCQHLGRHHVRGSAEFHEGDGRSGDAHV